MDFRPLSTLERDSLRNALRGNADDGKALLMNQKDTSFVGMTDEVADDEVIAAIKSVPCHYISSAPPPPHAKRSPSCPFLPLADKIVVKRLEPEKMTKGGIAIPDTAQKSSRRGEVLAVGPGKTLDDGTAEKIGVSIGDVVLFPPYSGHEIDLDGETYLILGQEEILATVS